MRVRHAEQSRARIARLGERRQGPDLDEAEAQSRERIDAGAVLVEARGKSHAIGKLEAHQAPRGGAPRGRTTSHEPQGIGYAQRPQSELVHALGLEPEQERTQRTVHPDPLSRAIPAGKINLASA